MDSPGRRRETFKTWPDWAKASVDSLVQAGFIYTGKGDRVECFQCKQTLEGWQDGDDPLKEHANYTTYCDFLAKLGPLNITKKRGNIAADGCAGNEPIGPDVTDTASAFACTEKKYDRPRYPGRKSVKDRESSFTETGNLDVERLVSEGFFFFEGENGEVIQCYNCGLELEAGVAYDELQDKHRDKHCTFCPENVPGVTSPNI